MDLVDRLRNIQEYSNKGEKRRFLALIISDYIDKHNAISRPCITQALCYVLGVENSSGNRQESGAKYISDKNFSQYGIKKTSIEEAIEKVWSNVNGRICCGLLHSKKSVIYYKDDNELERYIRSHTSLERGKVRFNIC